jgi:hypothetical protein
LGIRFVFDQGTSRARGISPQFVSDFLSTSAGRLQIDRFSRQIIGMTNINAEELRQIVLPLPRDEKKQKELVDEMNAARNGGMTRYSPGSDQSGQARYEKELKDDIRTATDISTIPVGPLPSPHPKTLEQMHEERRAAQQARQQAATQQMGNCTRLGQGAALKHNGGQDAAKA